MADSDLELASERLLATSPFHNEAYRKVWAKLRSAGIRTSCRRVLHLMREHRLLADQRTGRHRGPKDHDSRIVTEWVGWMRARI